MTKARSARVPRNVVHLGSKATPESAFSRLPGRVPEKAIRARGTSGVAKGREAARGMRPRRWSGRSSSPAAKQARRDFDVRSRVARGLGPPEGGVHILGPGVRGRTAVRGREPCREGRAVSGLEPGFLGLGPEPRVTSTGGGLRGRTGSGRKPRPPTATAPRDVQLGLVQQAVVRV